MSYTTITMLLCAVAMCNTCAQTQDIDFETMLTMNEADLKSIGIDLFGPRRKIATAIAQYASL